MDLTLLVQLLAPCLPFLLKLGEKSAENAAEKVGEDVWGKAKLIWSKLSPRVQAKEAAKEAVEDVAMKPEDEDLKTSLKVQLKKLLESDKELATEIAQILHSVSQFNREGTQIQQTVTGSDNQVIGQVHGDSRVTGNVQGNVTM